MAFSQADAESIPDCDDFTVYTANTPPETVVSESLNDNDPLGSAKPSTSLLVPWPGSTFIIRSASSGHVLTLLDGQIVLTQPGSRGSIYWVCVGTEGWLGFRNTVSGKFLGHDKKGKLCCSAERHRRWEYFCARTKPEGGCVLLMTHWESLWPVGYELEHGVEKLAKVGSGEAGAIVWEFAKI